MYNVYACFECDRKLPCILSIEDNGIPSTCVIGLNIHTNWNLWNNNNERNYEDVIKIHNVLSGGSNE